MTKELLFSVTANDCDFQYVKSGGPGGQNVNKRSTKVRCTHRASGATGESAETRHQSENKRIAFRKMAESKEFKLWHKLETARRMGDQLTIEEKVDKAMSDANLNIEGKLDGRWVPIEQAPFEEKE